MVSAARVVQSKFEDVNGDGVFYSDDRINLGNPIPGSRWCKLYSWIKGFDLSAYFVYFNW
jgi:hypothetical protein